MFCSSRGFIMGAFFENTQKPDTSKHSAAKMFTKNSQKTGRFGRFRELPMEGF